MPTGLNLTKSDRAQRIALTTALLLLIGLSFMSASMGRASRQESTAPRVYRAISQTQAPAPHVHTSKDDPSRFEFDSAEAMAAAGISLAPVEERSITEYLEAPGSVTYDKRLMSRVSSRAPGTVWCVEKRLGDFVSRGDVLAVVEAVEVGKLKAEFLDRLALCEAKAETVKLLQQASAAIPVSRMREAQLDLRECRLHLISAEQTLCNLCIPLRMKELEPLSDTERADRLQFLGIPERIVARLDREVATNNLVPVIASIDGVVINHEAGEGEWTDPSKPLFEIADVRKMWIRLDVPRDRASDVRLGQKLDFRGDGTTATVHCQISWISAEINRNHRILEVRAEFENPRLDLGEETPAQHRLLRANLSGIGRICVRHSPQAVTVPCHCLRRDGQGEVVFVQESETAFVAVRVERGACDGKFVEICGLVSPGSRVLCNGIELLTSVKGSTSTNKWNDDPETARSDLFSKPSADPTATDVGS